MNPRALWGPSNPWTDMSFSIPQKAGAKEMPPTGASVSTALCPEPFHAWAPGNQARWEQLRTQVEVLKFIAFFCFPLLPSHFVLTQSGSPTLLKACSLLHSFILHWSVPPIRPSSILDRPLWMKGIMPSWYNDCLGYMSERGWWGPSLDPKIPPSEDCRLFLCHQCQAGLFPRWNLQRISLSSPAIKKPMNRGAWVA